MPGLLQGLEIARRALVAHQSALSVTGNNLANVNTDGYSRQRAILIPTPDEQTTFGNIGTGVTMEGIERARDAFLDIQVRQEMGLAGRWQARSESLSRMESTLNEPSDQGLAQLLDGFWNAWLELSNQPEDMAARAVVVSSAQALVEGIHRIEAHMRQLAAETDVGISGSVTRVNGMLQELGQLNGQITQLEAGGHEEPGLRDRRDLVLDQLAGETGATHTARSDGSVYVRIGGRKAVDGTEVHPLASEPSARGGAMRIFFADVPGAPVSPSGRLGGLMEVREQEIPAFLAGLDQMAASLADSVNRLHAAGPSRLPFFRGDSAASLRVSPEIAADPSKVNAGSTGDSGDNDIAVALAALRDARVMNHGTASISDSYRIQVSALGTVAQEASHVSESQAAALQGLEAQRQAAVGVNVDEELTRMITTQRAYQAAARVLTVVDTMLDDLLKV